MRSAKFVTGSTLRHVLVMSSTASVGLLAMFAVDLADLFFLGLLGQLELAAAGFAWSIVFFNISLCVGLSITAAALVARALGGGGGSRARRWATNSAVGALLLSLPLAGLGVALAPALLRLLGADGPAFELALSYLYILMPSLPVMALAMVASGVLRAVGDARRGMYATLIGGAVNAALDPLLIFALGWGVPGAAVASVLGRLAIVVYAGWAVLQHHGLLGGFVWREFKQDLRPMLGIALPAIFTNIATPIAQAYVIGAAARFGDSAVAGMAIIGRIVPLAFVGLFAMSGAIGPIVGQNFGAGDLQRVRQTLRDSLLVATAYTLAVSLLLWASRFQLVALFNAQGTGAQLLLLFCTWIAPVWLFAGVTFITNAAFNNLGRAYLATLFNFGKATVGTMPLVALGGWWLGPPGVLVWQTLGSVVFGVGGAVTAFSLVARLERAGRAAEPALDGG